MVRWLTRHFEISLGNYPSFELPVTNAPVQHTNRRNTKLHGEHADINIHFRRKYFCNTKMIGRVVS